MGISEDTSSRKSNDEDYGGMRKEERKVKEEVLSIIISENEANSEEV